MRGDLGQGRGADGAPREVYLYHAVDNEWSMAEYGSQAVVWQAALSPVLALELLASGAWEGVGLLGPEALPPGPFLELVARQRRAVVHRGANALLSDRRGTGVDRGSVPQPWSGARSYAPDAESAGTSSPGTAGEKR